MMQVEFEHLTGLKVSGKEYQQIEKVYMANDYEKGVFCKMWVEASKEAREVMLSMVAKADHKEIEYIRDKGVMEGEYERNIARLEDNNKMLKKAICDIIEKCEDDAEMRKICAKAMGERDYLLYVLSEGKPLTEYDRTLMCEVLRNEIEL